MLSDACRLKVGPGSHRKRRVMAGLSEAGSGDGRMGREPDRARPRLDGAGLSARPASVSGDASATPRQEGAGAKRTWRQGLIHAEFLQELPIAVLSLFKGLQRARGDFLQLPREARTGPSSRAAKRRGDPGERRAPWFRWIAASPFGLLAMTALALTGSGPRQTPLWTRQRPFVALSTSTPSIAPIPADVHDLFAPALLWSIPLRSSPSALGRFAPKPTRRRAGAGAPAEEANPQATRARTAHGGKGEQGI